MNITKEMLEDKQKRIDVLREEEEKLADIISKEYEQYLAMNDIYVATCKLKELENEH